MRLSTLFATVLAVGTSITLAIPTPAPAVTIPESGIPFTDLSDNPDLAHEIFSSSSSSSSTTTTTSRLSKRAYAETANELTDGTACRDVTLIYARGTTQDGNIGAAGDVGPLFMNNLSAIIGTDSLAVQGVTYAANVLGFLEGGDPAGSQTMADLVAQANTQCPSTKIVISGYSQGGQLVHNAAKKLESNQAAVDQVAAVLIFGDPDDGDAVGTIPSSKVKIICHDGDNICAGGILILSPHLDYQIDALSAAQWVATMVE